MVSFENEKDDTKSNVNRMLRKECYEKNATKRKLRKECYENIYNVKRPASVTTWNHLKAANYRRGGDAQVNLHGISNRA
jgi:hypothetical protein